MATPHAKLNAGTETGAAKASHHLDALTRAYGRALRAAGRRAASAYRKTETVTAAANPELPPPIGQILNQEELAVDTQRKTAKLHRLMLAEAAQAALDPFEIRFDIHVPASQALLDQVGRRIQDGIASAIQEQIVEAIQNGYATGQSVSQVAGAIQQATDAISKPRADMLARTDLNALSNGGSLLAAQTSGAAATKTWIATNDERTRETHAEADGQTVPIDQPFDVGGESAQYPGDPNLSDEESCNCRCTIGYGEPLTASARIATPNDFAQFRDHLWDGFVAREPQTAVTSGGTMSDVTTDTLTAAATGDTGLPLSERDRAWDAGEATGRVKKWASSDGSGDPDKIDFSKLARAYFWQGTAGEGGPKIGDLKLPFADVIGGKLTAVWRGVTAGAQRLSQTDGVDKAAVQKKMSAYYSKAVKQYGDDSIKAPWASGSAAAVDGEQLAALRAYLADHGADVLEDDELRAIMLATTFAGGGGTKTVHFDVDQVTLLAASTDGTPWQATLCVADEPTVDSGIKRLLIQDGGTWRPLPLPLALLDDSPHADLTSKAPICGRIDQISWAGNVCQASGVFFDASTDANVAEAGSKARALVDEMGRLGISVDLVDCDVELMVWKGGEVSGLDDVNDPVAADDGDEPMGDAYDMVDSEAPVVIVDLDEVEYIMAFKNWVIAGATICPVQALTDATISLVASAIDRVGEWRTVTEFQLPGLTAGAAGLVPLQPPAEWFDDPRLEGPTPLTITDEGRVFGHLAAWDTCHTGRPGCVPPPRSPTGYMNFHLGEIKTAEGTRVAVGTLTFDAPHAPLPLSASQTVRHYDDTSTSGAHVRAGEDAYGIWLAGALNPRISAEEARTLMAAPPSGDWRQVNRGMGIDLVGAHAVNQPGFIVQRKGLSLAASGCDPCDEEFARQLAVLSASADGLEGLAALAEAAV